MTADSEMDAIMDIVNNTRQNMELGCTQEKISKWNGQTEWEGAESCKAKLG